MGAVRGDHADAAKNYASRGAFFPTDRPSSTHWRRWIGEEARSRRSCTTSATFDRAGAGVAAYTSAGGKPCKLVPILCGSFESSRRVARSRRHATFAAVLDVLRKAATAPNTAGRSRRADLAHVGPAFGDMSLRLRRTAAHRACGREPAGSGWSRATPKGSSPRSAPSRTSTRCAACRRSTCGCDARRAQRAAVGLQQCPADEREPRGSRSAGWRSCELPSRPGQVVRRSLCVT